MSIASSCWISVFTQKFKEGIYVTKSENLTDWIMKNTTFIEWRKNRKTCWTRERVCLAKNRGKWNDLCRRKDIEILQAWGAFCPLVKRVINQECKDTPKQHSLGRKGNIHKEIGKEVKIEKLRTVNISGSRKEQKMMCLLCAEKLYFPQWHWKQYSVERRIMHLFRIRSFFESSKDCKVWNPMKQKWSVQKRQSELKRKQGTPESLLMEETGDLNMISPIQSKEIPKI